ncbi:hypothetical protein IL306_008844 [Fusarium sp. DS 682]|nr:hypothetical protein IL306_008844 [Fusarium sp. DS 682]
MATENINNPQHHGLGNMDRDVIETIHNWLDLCKTQIYTIYAHGEAAGIDYGRSAAHLNAIHVIEIANQRADDAIKEAKREADAAIKEAKQRADTAIEEANQWAKVGRDANPRLEYLAEGLYSCLMEHAGIMSSLSRFAEEGRDYMADSDSDEPDALGNDTADQEAPETSSSGTGQSTQVDSQVVEGNRQDEEAMPIKSENAEEVLHGLSGFDGLPASETYSCKRQRTH